MLKRLFLLAVGGGGVLAFPAWANHNLPAVIKRERSLPYRRLSNQETEKQGGIEFEVSIAPCKRGKKKKSTARWTEAVVRAFMGLIHIQGERDKAKASLLGNRRGDYRLRQGTIFGPILIGRKNSINRTRRKAGQGAVFPVRSFTSERKHWAKSASWNKSMDLKEKVERDVWCCGCQKAKAAQK